MLKKKQKKKHTEGNKATHFSSTLNYWFQLPLFQLHKNFIKKAGTKNLTKHSRLRGGGILSAPFNKFSIVNKYLIFGLDLTLEGLKILWLHSIKTKSYIGRSDTIKFLLWMDYKLAFQNEQYAMLSLITTSFKSETPVSWTPLYFANKYMSSRNWRDK